MMLDSLLPELTLSEEKIPLTGITDDSRKVVAGNLFLAISGAQHDAKDSIAEAVKKSAAAIICENADLENTTARVPVYSLPELAIRRSEIAGRFYANPSKDMFVVAVTGTNGKTSCTHFIAQALEILGVSAGLIGTIGNGRLQALTETNLTTPSAVMLQSFIKKFKNDGVSAVCIEASSHGLDQERLKGVDVDIAVFTNLTRDHLDYHGGVDNYKRAKQKLFQLSSLSTAVINIDDDFGRELSESIISNIKVLTCSLKDSSADIYVESVKYHQGGFDALIICPWGDLSVNSELLGEHNLSNLLVVLAVLGEKGYPISDISLAMSKLENVKGRMHRLSNTGDIAVVVDYAHTPDALEKSLKSLVLHCEEKIWCVMGCGGDRDSGKRPLMGEISSRLSNYTVVTSDNPRTENPDSIIGDILEGCHSQSQVYSEPDRRKAIKFALDQASSGDIVLIAGKGHEEYQDLGGVRTPFSDFRVVEQCLSGKSGGA